MPSPSRTKAAYPPETKAAALAALLAGQSVSAVAREYQIPKGTVSNWKTRRAGVSDVPDAGTQKAESIGDLLVTLLEQNIRGLIAASAVMQDPEWVKRQEASELGVFLGITHDKVVRMLEAMDRSAGPATPAS